MSEQTMVTVLEWLLVATAVPATLFPLLYATRSPWWVSHTGRSLLSQSVAVALLVDMTAAFHFLALDLTLNQMFVAEAFAFGFAALSTTYLLIVLLITQAKRERSE